MARNDLTVLGDDTFIVSYPKSGNTWMRFLLGTAIKQIKVDWFTVDSTVPAIYRLPDKNLLKINRPRLLKSHHSYDLRYPKVIYIVRNPIDVCVSYYYFKLKFTKLNKTPNFTDYFENFLDGSLDDFGSWSFNVSSWVHSNHNKEGRIMFCRYEDMISNTEAELSKILKFMGISVSDSFLKEAISWSSRDNMAKLEKRDSMSPLFKNTDKSINFVSNKTDYKKRILLSEVQKEKIYSKFSVMMKYFNY